MNRSGFPLLIALQICYDKNPSLNVVDFFLSYYYYYQVFLSTYFCSRHCAKASAFSCRMERLFLNSGADRSAPISVAWAPKG